MYWTVRLGGVDVGLYKTQLLQSCGILKTLPIVASGAQRWASLQDPVGIQPSSLPFSTVMDHFHSAHYISIGFNDSRTSISALGFACEPKLNAKFIQQIFSFYQLQF